MKKIIIILFSLFLLSCEKNIENEKNNSFSGDLENNLILYKYEILPEIKNLLEQKYINSPHSGYYLEKEKFKEVEKKDFIGGINFDLNGEKVGCIEDEITHISKFYNFTNCIPKYYVSENEMGGPFVPVGDGTGLFTKGKIYESPDGEKNKHIFQFRENSILFRDFSLFLNLEKKYFLKLEKNGNYYSVDIFDENKKYLRTALIMEKISKNDFLKDEKYFSIIFDKNERDNRRFLETMRILEK